MLFSYFRNARVLNLGGGPKTIKINLKSIFMLGFWKWGSVHWSFKEDGEQPLLHGWFNVSFWQPRMLQLRFSWHIGGTGLDDFSERYVFTCTLLCHGCFKSFQCIWMIFLINLQKYRKEKRWGQNKIAQIKTVQSPKYWISLLLWAMRLIFLFSHNQIVELPLPILIAREN